MPAPIVPRDLKPIISGFTKEQKIFLSTPQGKADLVTVKTFAQDSSLPVIKGEIDQRQRDAATVTLAWITRLPEKLVGNPQAPMIDFSNLGEKERAQAITEGLQVIASGAKALLLGDSEDPKRACDAMVQGFIGADKASEAMRKSVVDPKFPVIVRPTLNPRGILDIDKLVREGVINEFLKALKIAGMRNRESRDSKYKAIAFGSIKSIKSDRNCGGEQIIIYFAGFGETPPPDGEDIFISFPTPQGCSHISLRSIAPKLFAPKRLMGDMTPRVETLRMETLREGLPIRTPHFNEPKEWMSEGKITVELPKDITSGCIGFFRVKKRPEEGDVGVGDLITAAGMMQTTFEPYGGVQLFQNVSDLATRLEAGMLGEASLPCAGCQLDNANHIEAGPPIINFFRVKESGPIYPRGTVTLEWSVENADRIEIEARSVAGSENPHELPKIITPIPSKDQRIIAISCTCRWEGEYVLRAMNKNGCIKVPLEALVPLMSGYSNYRVGAAKADVTDLRIGLPMQGYAWKGQKSSGSLLKDSNNVEIPLFARAFVIEENRAVSPSLVAIVVVDIWSCTLAIKREVVKRLNQHHASALFSDETVLIAGTHTHSAPGGISEYFLYNLTIGGFDQQVFDRVVNGIVSAINSALLNKAPGRILANEADLADCGANHSIDAFKLNHDFDRTKPDLWTDRQMLLLKFVVDVNNRGETRPVGALNWFALHPTSLGMFNNQISGDNKGRASFLFEDYMKRHTPEFIAAFGNGSTGDVCGNLTFDAKGIPTIQKPLGGSIIPQCSIPAVVRSPLAFMSDVKRMEMFADRQYNHALNLFETATEEITGSIGASLQFNDMSNISITGIPLARTYDPALGISFGSGSSEDSIAYATVDLGPSSTLDIDAGIIEGMDVGARTLGILGTIATAVVAGPAILGTIVSLMTGAPVLPSALPPVLLALPLFVVPQIRSYIASLVAAAMFPGELKNCGPQSREGTWTWIQQDPANLSAAYIAGHGEKPIMFHLGNWYLNFIPNPGSTKIPSLLPCPLVPHILPSHLLRIGSVVIAGVPHEFTTTSGRRLKDQLRAAFGDALTHVAISNYTNGYAGYVTTPEEYRAQNYEGASTLYGPYTLAAYLQIFDRLTTAILNGTPLARTVPFDVPAVFHKP